MLFTRRLSIQSKLILLLLLVSLGSMLPLAIIGYQSGREALTQSVTNQLTSLREAKADLLRARLELIRNQALTLSEDRMFVEAMKEFLAGFKKLQATTLTAEQQAKLKKFYEKDFLAELQKKSDEVQKKSDGKPKKSDVKPILPSYLPHSAAGKYLQFHYLADNPDPYADKNILDVAEDGSDYSAAHKKYHPLIRSVADRFRYEDILLVHPESGEVIYDARKTTVFATNLLDGPYSETNLAGLVKSFRQEKKAGLCRFTRYEKYVPSLNKPAAFVASPITDAEQVMGLLVFQFTTDEFSRVLTGNMTWERDGLGKTGEVYLAGADGKMQSDARFYLEDGKAYLETLRKAGYPQAQLDDIRRSETTILTQDARTDVIDSALKGHSATDIITDYRGVQVLAAYAPLEAQEYRWVLVAKQDVEEAFAPIRAFGRQVLITAGATTLVVSLLAVWLSALFVRPIHQLTDGAKQVSKGALDTTVKVTSKDEFRELADSFNEMTTSLKMKSELAEQKTQDYEQLLLSVLPPSAAQRFKGGAEQISDAHADVTVLFAEITDFVDLTRSMPPDQAVGLFHDLIVAFDEAAERHGVEKVKTVGSSYVAACGVTTLRVDHTQRVVEYAQELLRIVRHFNQERGTKLGVQISIHSGPVVGGVVGRTRFIYDLWGDTVNVARALQTDGDVNTIRVTEAVHQRLNGVHTFRGPQQVQIPGKGEMSVWVVEAEKVATP